MAADLPDSPSAGYSRTSRSVVVSGLLLAGAIVAAYWNTVATPFLLDDTRSIVENVSIRRLWPPGPVLSPPADAGFGGRPVANLTLALNYAAHGLDVRGYHVVNLAIHLAAAFAVFGLTRRTLALPRVGAQLSINPASATSIAYGAAALWALHPLQTESITYISQRTEALMALFFLLTIYAFARAAPASSARWGAVAAIACGLGMATKEVMVTAPVVVWLYDRTFVAGSFREAWRARRRLHLALAATWLVLLFLIVDVHERGVGYAAVTWWEYALTETRAILHYLRLALWPAPLVFDYGTAVARSALEVWPHLLGFAVLVTAVGVALKRAPRIGFLGAWVLIILAPASSIVPVAGQPMAEHRMYLPLVAIATGAALLLHRWLGRRAVLGTALICLLLAAATIDRNRDYRDAATLWSDTVAKRPANARAHAALGAALLESGRLQPAIAALERALELDPRIAEAHNNLATVLPDVNRTADALAHFTAALRLRPGTPSTHYNFGNALLATGRASEAIAQQEQALLLRPEFPEATCALANALAAAGRLTDAIPHFQTALRQRPDLTAAHFGLANALTQAGRAAEAIGHYEATLRAVPNAAEAHYRFANALAQSGDVTRAMAHYETALRLQPDLAPARQNLEALRRASGSK